MPTHPKTKQDFLGFCQTHLDLCDDVSIDTDTMERFASSLEKSERAAACTRGINTQPFNKLWPDIFDMVVNTSNDCGSYDLKEGQLRHWAIDGSGSKAMESFFAELRMHSLLPDAHARNLYSPALINAMKGKPYADLRLRILAEIFDPQKTAKLKTLFRRAVEYKSRFDYEGCLELTALYPLGFGEDPFLKKAFLVSILLDTLLTDGEGGTRPDIALAADFRVAQTLHNIGILTFSPALVEALESSTIFNKDSQRVNAIRAASILAADKILEIRPDLTLPALDYQLWSAGRDTKKLIALREQFGNHNPHLTTKPMIALTMRF